MTRRDVAAMRLALEMLRLAYTGEYEVARVAASMRREDGEA